MSGVVTGRGPATTLTTVSGETPACQGRFDAGLAHLAVPGGRYDIIVTNPD